MGKAKRAAADVTVRWGEDILAARRIDAAAPLVLGDGVDVGAGSKVLARCEGGRVIVDVPPGASASRGEDAIDTPSFELAIGEDATIALGSIRVTIEACEAKLGGTKRDRRVLGGARTHVAIAALLHVVLLGFGRSASAYAIPDDNDDATATMRSYLATAERNRVEDQPASFVDETDERSGAYVNGKNGDGKEGGGDRRAGEEGKMGSRLSHAKERRWSAPMRDASSTQADSIEDARTFGMLGLFGDQPSGAVAWDHGFEGGDRSDLFASNGVMNASKNGEAFGAGGLGLSGIGEGGGGSGVGIGLGLVGTIGHTDGVAGRHGGGAGDQVSGLGFGGGGGWGDSIGIGIGGIGTIGHRARSTTCEWGEAAVSGRLPPEAIRRIIRQNEGRFRLCYEKGLVGNPKLAGRVTSSFVIGRDGAVSSAANAGGDLPDANVKSCVARAFASLQFPQPEGGIVTVVYPFTFSPL